MLLSSALLLSHTLCEQDRRRWKQVGAFLALLRTVKNRIDCYGEPIDTILSRCDAALLLACGHRAGRDAPDFFAFLEGCELCLSEGERQILYEFSGELGRGYRAEQVKVCEYYMARLDRAREALEEELPGRRKMIRTVCLSASLGAILMLI